MTRRIIALLLIALLLLQVGCKNKKNDDVAIPTDTTEATEQIDATMEDNAPTETLHPALTDNPFDGALEETAIATEPVADETEEATEATEATEAPAEAPEATEAPEDDGVMTYEKYMALSAEEQYAFMNSFESIDAFFAWFNAAKAAYDAKNPDIEVGDGSFDLGELGG